MGEAHSTAKPTSPGRSELVFARLAVSRPVAAREICFNAPASTAAMDWFLDPADALAARELRREFLVYLRRHGEPCSDFAAAEVAFGEVVSNVARHTDGPAWISVDWSEESPVLTVRDTGPGFEPELSPPDALSPSGRGLYLVAHLTEELKVAPRRRGGSAVSVVLPVTRRREAEPGSSPPLRRAAPTEAVEAAIVRVGMDVGVRLEEEYRRAHAVTDHLTPEQIAELCVRMQGALDGDFYVIETSEERIVLGNRRCPFGDAVTRAPALCRMTSSVLGGIAARNTGAGAIELEERIAFGDPECRVTVWLGCQAMDRPAQAHRYGLA